MTKKLPQNQGYVVMVLAIIFAGVGLTLVSGGAVPVAAHWGSTQGYSFSKQALLASDSAVNEAVYRLKTGKNLPASVNISLNTGSSTITNTAIPGGRQISVSGNYKNYVRNFSASLIYGSGASFHYGVQVGNGGFELQNSSSVTGNIYANGSVLGVGNQVSGGVVSAGPSGLIDNISVGGSAYAQTIRNSNIGGDAYYVAISGTTVAGSLYPNSPNQATATMPISDEQITEWENAAVTGGNAICSEGKYTISSNVTIGPKKIPCDLEIKGSAVVTLTGPIWITGNIIVENTAEVNVSSSLGSVSLPIIARNPSDSSGSGMITLKNNTQYSGSGVGSYILMISQNNSAETGGGNTAISLDNSASGDLILYASHGKIDVSNNVQLTAVTGYKIVLQNSANVRYETGLANLIFQSGPSGGFRIDSWKEQ